MYIIHTNTKQTIINFGGAMIPFTSQGIRAINSSKNPTITCINICRSTMYMYDRGEVSQAEALKAIRAFLFAIEYGSKPMIQNQ